MKTISVITIYRRSKDDHYRVALKLTRFRHTAMTGSYVGYDDAKHLAVTLASIIEPSRCLRIRYRGSRNEKSHVSKKRQRELDKALIEILDESLVLKGEQ